MKNLKKLSFLMILLTMVESISAEVAVLPVIKNSCFDQAMVTIENDDLEASPYGPTMMQGFANEVDMIDKLDVVIFGATSVYAPIVASTYAPVVAGMQIKMASAMQIGLAQASQGLVKSVCFGAFAGGSFGAGKAYLEGQNVLQGAALGAFEGSSIGATFAIPYQAGATVATGLGVSGRGQVWAGMGSLVGLGALMVNKLQKDRDIKLSANSAATKATIDEKAQ